MVNAKSREQKKRRKEHQKMNYEKRRRGKDRGNVIRIHLKEKFRISRSGILYCSAINSLSTYCIKLKTQGKTQKIIFSRIKKKNLCIFQENVKLCFQGFFQKKI